MVTRGTAGESYRAWLSRFFVVGLAAALAALIALAPLPGSALLIFGAILVVAVLVEPRWGLYLLPFTVPFGSVREISVGPATVGGTEALLGLFLAAWLARGVARRALRLRLPPLAGAFALWYGVMLLSLLNSASLADSLKELVKWAETFAVFAIAARWRHACRGCAGGGGRDLSIRVPRRSRGFFVSPRGAYLAARLRALHPAQPVRGVSGARFAPWL
jgi:hypothetical protein